MTITDKLCDMLDDLTNELRGVDTGLTHDFAQDQRIEILAHTVDRLMRILIEASTEAHEKE